MKKALSKMEKQFLFDEEHCKTIYENLKECEKEIFEKEQFDKLAKIDYHRKKADKSMTRRLVKTTLGKWKDEYKAEII
jgi:hypothetical protein